MDMRNKGCYINRINQHGLLICGKIHRITEKIQSRLTRIYSISVDEFIKKFIKI